MYTINIFNKEIKLRDYYCQRDDLSPCKIDVPYTNIYISLTNQCNAKCEFCCNNHIGEKCNFDIEKFKTIIATLNKIVRIHKCSFTGGEPSLTKNTLVDCLTFVKNINKEIFTVVNTNGTNLKLLENNLQYIDSIALSRHHYNDSINEIIFQNQLLPTTQDISQFPDKSKLHLSCNLIKEHIGNINEVLNYLEWVSTTGCYDVGFVSLMQVNNYCKENFVDFKDLNFENTDNVFVIKNWNYQNLCRCRNYNYIAKNAEILDVYARYYVNPNYSGNALVFDGQYLRLGFNGEIIY